MLERYEQKKMIEYYLKILSVKSLSIKEKNGMVQSFANHFLSCQESDTISFCKEIVDKTNEMSAPRYETSIADIKYIKDNLQKALKKHKCAKQSLRQKKLDFIAHIYDLNEEEKIILDFIARVAISASFGELPDFIRCCDRHKKSFFKKVFSSTTIHQSYNKIRNEFLTSSYDICLDDIFYEFLENDEIKTEKQFISYFTGDALSSSLSLKDFKYIKNDVKIASNILQKGVQAHQKGINILFYGVPGTGKTELAKAIAKAIKTKLISVSFTDSCDEEADRRDRLISYTSKQKSISKFNKNFVILFDEAEDVLNGTQKMHGSVSKAYINNLLETNQVPTIWTTNDINSVDKAFLRRMTYSIKFEELTEDLRLKFWKKELKKQNFEIETNDLKRICKKYTVSQSTITNAINITKMLDGDNSNFENMIHKSYVLLNNGQEMKPELTSNKAMDFNENLVNTDIEIKNLTKRFKELGKLNFSLCLYGEPGTGKSLYARHLAKSLKIPVIMKRASDLTSKWVGETEQNIAKAFNEAKDKKAMLIIDEADSFLRSRGFANHSWEISAVNEMLTQMETHEYPFVCTTNLIDTLDEASLRRFTFKIQFDFLSKGQVNLAIKHFFNINSDVDIKGLTCGDFATVKKKAEFLEIKDLKTLVKMLNDEVKLKQSKSLKQVVGF